MRKREVSHSRRQESLLLLTQLFSPFGEGNGMAEGVIRYIAIVVSVVFLRILKDLHHIESNCCSFGFFSSGESQIAN